MLKPWMVPLLFTALMPAGLAAAEPGAFHAIGPWGADVVDVVADPLDANRVYAATASAGVFRSDDGGATWVAARAGFPLEGTLGNNRPLYDLAADPADGRLYALGEPVVYVSDDRGSSWQALPSYIVNTKTSLRRIFVEGAQGLLAATNEAGYGVFTSADRGQTWTASNTGIATVKIQTLESTGGGTAYAVAGDVVYRSVDHGGTWESRGALPASGLRDLAVSPLDGGRIYVATANGVFRSPDGGGTWVRIDDPADAVDAEFVFEGTRVLVFGRGRLYTMALDDDALVPGAAYYHTRTTAATAMPGGGVLAGAKAGVFRGDSGVLAGTAEFAFSSRGISGVDAAAIGFATGSDVLYVATGQGYEAGVMRSDDGGATWQLRSKGITNLDLRSIAVAPGDPDVVYAGSVDATSETGESGRIFKTVDGGLTWTDVTAGIDHEGPHIIISIVVHPVNPDIVYASVQGLYGGIYKSIDGGTTWQRRATGLESMPPPTPELGSGWDGFVNYFAVLSQVIDPRDPETIYAGGGGCWGGVYITHNGAESWVRRDQHEGAMEVDFTVSPDRRWESDNIFGIHLELFDIDVDRSNPDHLLASGGRGRYPEGYPQWGIVYESHDAGATWHLIREGNRGTTADYFTDPVIGVAIHPVEGNRLYVATRGGVQTTATPSVATSWVDMNEGLSSRELFTRTIGFDPDDPTRLYLGTLTGVWVRELDPTPVRLLSCEARFEEGRGVVLTWATADAVDHAGFLVDRIDAEGGTVRLTRELVTGAGPVTWLDPRPVRGARQSYRVVEVDRTGRETELATREVFVPAIAGLALGPARPNPAGATTALTLAVSARERVSVRVFDARGAVVATLLDEVLDPGEREIRWNPRAAGSVNQVSGVFFLSARTASERVTRKVLVLP